MSCSFGLGGMLFVEVVEGVSGSEGPTGEFCGVGDCPR